jgi:ribulose-5-phosphate 4-epimerase/fuculose-1-phosphate aldolase
MSSAKTTTTTRRRMDVLMRHLTAEPDDVGQPRFDANLASSSTPSPDRRRKQALSQKERLREYGYRLAEDEATEPELILVDEVRPSSNNPADEPQGGTASASPRSELAKVCRAAFLIKPLGVRFSEVTAASLVLVQDLAELPLHQAVYVSRPDVMCVLSAANRDCELVSVTTDGLLPLCQDSLRVYHTTRKADDSNLAVRAARASHRDVSCWLVKNRGLVACAPSMSATLASALFATRAANFQIRTLTAVGGDMKRLDVLSESDAVRARTSLEVRLPCHVLAEQLLSRLQ